MARKPPKLSEIRLRYPYSHLNILRDSSPVSVNPRANSQKGWKVIGDKRCYFKSKAEHRYALYLQFLKDHNQIFDWEYEPQTFWFPGIKRGQVSYKPDFRILNANKPNEWVEVKGYMDSKSLTKIKRFRKYYPDQKLIIVDQKWFSKNTPKLKNLIKGWQ